MCVNKIISHCTVQINGDSFTKEIKTQLKYYVKSASCNSGNTISEYCRFLIAAAALLRFLLMK